MNHHKFLTSGPQRPMLDRRNVERDQVLVLDVSLAVPRDSSVHPEGRRTAVNAKAAAWLRQIVCPAVHLLVENVSQEAFL